MYLMADFHTKGNGNKVNVTFRVGENINKVIKIRFHSSY